MAAANLTADRLRELLHYDPETGLFANNGTRHGVARGSPTGTLDASNGYVKIGVCGRRYYAHRLAWFYVYGEWPENDIDHLNGVRSDNRIANLRAATRALNMQNLRRANENSSSGLLGVERIGNRGFWCARIGVFGKRVYLGCFNNPEDAHQAYLEAKRRLHPGCTI